MFILLPISQSNFILASQLFQVIYLIYSKNTATLILRVHTAPDEENKKL